MLVVYFCMCSYGLDQVPKKIGGGKRGRCSMRDMAAKDSDPLTVVACFDMESFDIESWLESLNKDN